MGRILIRKIMLILFSFAVLFVGVLTKNEEYIGFKVYNVKLHNGIQQDDLYKLKSDIIDFWRKPCVKHNVIGKAMVPPSHADWFEEKLAEMDIEREVYIQDVHEYLAQRELAQTSRNEEDNVFGFNGYYRYNVILDHLYTLQDAYASLRTEVEVVVYGQTDENRPLVYVKLLNNSTNSSDKPVVIVEAAINPRDWVTVPSALNVLNQLLEDENRSILDTAVWIIIPVLNPDGYEYTHTNLRLWTKSRSIRSQLGFICPGVNIDRNFDIDWQISDSSSSPCSHLYAGTEAFSEIESRMIRDLLDQYKPTLYISLQNTGKFITYPWRYEKAASGLYRRQYLKGLELLEAVGEDYRLDSGAMAIGDRESGTSVDFARRSGVFYTYNVGLDGDGDDGVLVPEEDIMNVADDVWRAVMAAARNLEL